MTVLDPDQGITLQVGTDPANYPSAQNAMFAGLLSRLNLRYANEATRTANHPVSVENEVSWLADVDRGEVYNGANWISLAGPRSYWTYARRGSDSAPINNSTVLVNDTVLLAPMPTGGTFSWETVVYYDSSQAADLKIAYTWPAGAAVKWGITGLAVGAVASTGDAQFLVTSVSGNPIPIGGANAGTVLMAIIRGDYIAGGTAGNLQHQAAQQTADPTNTTPSRFGSVMRVWRTG